VIQIVASIMIYHDHDIEKLQSLAATSHSQPRPTANADCVLGKRHGIE
jgi:hypothetical protein